MHIYLQGRQLSSLLLNFFPVMNIPENSSGFCKGKYCVIWGWQGKAARQQSPISYGDEIVQ